MSILDTILGNDSQHLPDAAVAQTFAAHELKRAFGTAILPF